MIVSLGVALVLSPLLGAVADQNGRKKAFLLATWLLCVVCCGLLSFVGPDAHLGGLDARRAGEHRLLAR